MKILGGIPKSRFWVACSGGSDSMALIDLLLRYPKNRFGILHFNHGTECCGEAEDFVRDFCGEHGIELVVGRAGRTRRSGESREEWWRDMRYAFLETHADRPILMAHHLNDVAETWIMTSLHGRPRLIPYSNPRYRLIRPMLATPKADIEEWNRVHGVKWVLDRSNLDTSIPRNMVRHEIMSRALAVNPGFLTTLRKKVEAEYQAEREV